jgi:hypothetical protein
MMTIWSKSEKGTIHKFSGITAVNWECPEAIESSIHSLQMPWKEGGGLKD